MFRIIGGAAPQFIAWWSLSTPPLYGMVALMTGFVVAFSIDALSATRGLYPAWFLKLRVMLTLIAVLSLGVNFWQM